MNSEVCNNDVYEYGKVIGIYNMSKDEAEAFCRDCTLETGKKTDWHFAGGRVVIKQIKGNIIWLKIRRKIDRLFIR